MPLKKRWIEPQPVHVPAIFQTAIGGHPLIAQQLVRRGLRDIDSAFQFLDVNRYTPAPPDELPDMDEAVSRIQKAVKDKETILVWGDFDVDGQTSTALLVSALNDLGANVSYHIPNRFTEGHGIHLTTLKRLLDKGVDLLLTCDTGVAAHESIAYAQSHDVDVVVTDHHALPETLPNAYAVVNPMRLKRGHPLRELSGVGVAYKVMQALYGNTSTDHLLDLVAIGLVADVMVLKDDTRYLVQRGLEVLRHTERAGLRVMMERAEIDQSTVNEEHIGFVLAPQLNAVGRLDDANISVELLTSSDIERTTIIANTLEGFNAERKLLSTQVYKGAQAVIERDPSLLEYKALVLDHAGWHTGVVGIVASRLAEAYNRPAVLLSVNDDTASGSARSIEGCDITQAIKEHAEMLNRFGGHTMAAGLSLPAENIIGFRRALSGSVREQLRDKDLTPTIEIDAFLNFGDLSLDLAREINRLAPFGNGNPPLTLASQNLRVKSRRYVGRRQEHVELNVQDENGITQKVMWWRADLDDLPQGRFDLAYTLRENEFRGERQLMVEWLDARPAAGEQPVEIVSGPRYWVEDFRNDPLARSKLEKVRSNYPDALIWSEHDARIEGGRRRYELSPCETLIVWSAPPGSAEWEFVLDAVQPERLILFGEKTAPDTATDFIKTLAGMAKHVINQRDGLIEIERASAALGHRQKTIELGLGWLAARGQITIIDQTDVGMRIIQGGEAQDTLENLQNRLEGLLRDTRAYREYWRKMTMESRQ